MANLANAKKAIRVQDRKAEINTRLRINVKKAIKETKKFVEANDKDGAEKQLMVAYKALDKASKRYMHKNTASRTKSRLAKLVSKME